MKTLQQSIRPWRAHDHLYISPKKEKHFSTNLNTNLIKTKKQNYNTNTYKT